MNTMLAISLISGLILLYMDGGKLFAIWAVAFLIGWGALLYPEDTLALLGLSVFIATAAMFAYGAWTFVISPALEDYEP